MGLAAPNASHKSERAVRRRINQPQYVGLTNRTTRASHLDCMGGYENEMIGGLFRTSGRVCQAR